MILTKKSFPERGIERQRNKYIARKLDEGSKEQGVCVPKTSIVN